MSLRILIFDTEKTMKKSFGIILRIKTKGLEFYLKFDTLYRINNDALLMMFGMENMENMPRNPTI